ncbi:MAG: Lysophospholipase L1 and related esterases [uncultured Segetibacter sp.]|uniref:Lysophospholipase L1 and related esterases n=1 Tax=uncultured Segetibacter sp. TaxID=481133 RepID=A0A6J4SID2_9BACT|nr:MAG: Lysophospholipase L1 and related esterases [uncultured Segetibacter sp.]
MKKDIQLSFFMIISLLFALFSCFSCNKEEKLPRGETVIIAKDTMINKDTSIAIPAAGAKYLALGDSYTIGQNVHETERFPAQTAQLLRAHNIDVRDPQYIASTGWTTTNLLSGINLQNPARDFDIVTLLIGVNDQYQRRDTTSYRTHFLELLDKAVEFARSKKSRVFVLSIPDYSVTPFVAAEDKAGVSKQIDEFNAINKEITLQNGIVYIDITPSTRGAANDTSLIANDGLHLSGKEYAAWAGMLAPLIKKALQ